MALGSKLKLVSFIIAFSVGIILLFDVDVYFQSWIKMTPKPDNQTGTLVPPSISGAKAENVSTAEIIINNNAQSLKHGDMYHEIIQSSATMVLGSHFLESSMTLAGNFLAPISSTMLPLEAIPLNLSSLQASRVMPSPMPSDVLVADGSSTVSPSTPYSKKSNPIAFSTALPMSGNLMVTDGSSKASQSIPYPKKTNMMPSFQTSAFIQPSFTTPQVVVQENSSSLPKSILYPQSISSSHSTPALTSIQSTNPVEALSTDIQQTPSSPHLEPTVSEINQQVVVTDSNYILHLPGCQMKYYKPFDEEVKPFYAKTTDLKCDPSFVFANGTELTIDKLRMAKKMGITKDDITCRAYRIRRSQEGYSDNAYAVVYLQDILTERFKATHEFIEIRCTDQTNKVIYDDFFAFILTKQSVEQRCNAAQKSLPGNDKQQERFSVMFIGLDSVSHRNFLRQCPKTYSELRKNFDPLEFNGYTKLGENTYPSLLPLFTGQSEEELNLGAGPFNLAPLIWKNFSSHGYRTLLAEDWPGAAIFNYIKRGFYYQPTDYYLRPFSLAAEDSEMMKMSKKYCFNSRTELSVNLEWCKALLTVFSDKPVFSFTFATRLTHDYLNYAGYADDSLFDFVHWYKNSDARNNTFLILFSDHGIRWGGFRQTDMGTQEASLPLFLLMLPPRFQTQYPELYKSLKTNQNRLVTMYDVHEMLKDMLNFTGIPSTVRPNVLQQRGINLFDTIPTERTCDDAGIPAEYCACHFRRHIDTDNPGLTVVAQKLVDSINKETRNERQRCVLLELQTIGKASLSHVIKRSEQKKLKTMDSYKLWISTVPGQAVFEGVVLCELNSTSACTVQGRVSRINKYGDESICIYDSVMKNYCYCKQKVKPWSIFNLFGLA